MARQAVVHRSLQLLRHRLDRRLRLANRLFVFARPNAGLDKTPHGLGQRRVERLQPVVFGSTDRLECEIHAQDPKTFRTTVFARRVTRR